MNTHGQHYRRHPDPDPAAPASTTKPEASRVGQPEPGPPGDRLAYSVDEAARLTGLSRDLLYDQMRRGNLPYLKVGRRRLITRHHLQQFLGIPDDHDHPAPVPVRLDADQIPARHQAHAVAS
jgi:excisionase family DNA binding protein